MGPAVTPQLQRRALQRRALHVAFAIVAARAAVERERRADAAAGEDSPGKAARRSVAVQRQRWAELALWIFAGSVFVPALPSLWRVSESSGKRALLRIAGAIAALRFVPPLRRLHQAAAEVAVPAACASALLATLVLRKRPGGRQVAAKLLRAAATFAAPGVLLAGIEDPGSSDVIALAGSALSLLLGQNAACVLLLLMVTGGEALEERVVRRAGNSVRAVIDQQRPKTVCRIRADHTEETAPVSEVVPGDRIVLREGDTVPCDGQVEAGMATFDESALTGESMQQSHSPHSQNVRCSSVLSGAVVVAAEGRVVLRVKRPAAESCLALLSNALEQALSREAEMEQTAGRAAVLFPAFTFAAAAASFSWRARPLRARWEASLALLSAATTCPLSIGVPVAFLSGISVAARCGITVKSGAALERLGAATMVVFDKTGTLTQGRPRVANICPAAAYTVDSLLAVAGAAEQGSGHVLARAVRHCCAHRGVKLPRVRAGSLMSVHGKGVTAELEAEGGGWQKVGIGSALLLSDLGVQLPKTVIDTAEMSVHVAVDGAYAGTLHFEDELRPHVRELIKRLRASRTARGRPFRLAILSGDPSGRLRRVAEDLGISTWRCCLPHEKAKVIEEWRQEGHCVVMVGDGVNDAAALAMSHVGVSIGTNALASESADVVLVQQELLLVDTALRLGRHVLRKAKRGVICGMGASGVQMVLAEAGVLSAFANSLLQELVDLSAILHSASVLLHR
eukprot:TRINITY_DN59985_c0_g1_i1.p1 TRINITY_DN59985_c0_g1~~TRINITY_DN59985_c0_g1_i1.p1  ORF type:complete len:740 (+),score=222.10 TRINITY_DN59985_c0_g1_i1:67-2286(+)